MHGLDGLTLLRYGHVYDAGGGMEQYLADLNKALHSRSNFRTIQIELTSFPDRVGETQRGPIKKVSLFVDQQSHEAAVLGRSRFQIFGRVKTWVTQRIVSSPLIDARIIRRLLVRISAKRRAGEPIGAGNAVLALHRESPLDLICLHSIGGADSSEILAVARAERIPVVYVHHFSNDRLSAFSVRFQLENVYAVGGVSNVDVPRFISNRFADVLDGIDIGFFQRSEARPIGRKNPHPIIFLPSRITPAKGQIDVVLAAAELKRRGLNVSIVFAGRTDTPEFQKELSARIQKEGLVDDVEFVGQLQPQQLRDWYASAEIIAFPTRHHEGLPRILMECQAMEVPPIVYDIGGTRSGVQDGVTGFVVASGDFRAFVARMEELLRNKAQRTAMGKAGRKWVETRFSLADLALRHEELYQKAMASRTNTTGLNSSASLRSNSDVTSAGFRG